MGPGWFRAAYLRVSSGLGTNFWTREDLYTMNGCEHYKVGQFQRRKDSLVLLTREYVSIFKEFATDDSNKCWAV